MQRILLLWAFLFWRGNISRFCFLLRHSLDAWLFSFTSGHHSITQQHSLIPVRCVYTTANLYTIWSLCQPVFLCVFYIVCRVLSSTKLSGNKLTVSFLWSRAKKWVYIIMVLCSIRLWTLWFWNYEPSNRFGHWNPQQSHQLASFIYYFAYSNMEHSKQLIPIATKIPKIKYIYVE